MAMFSKLKAAWSQLGGGSSTPYPANGVYQTAGIIEKDAADGVKEHRFIRADTHQSKEDAVAFAISKAKQIIDLQGDRCFSADRTDKKPL